MSDFQTVFKRYEKKYLLSNSQYNLIRRFLESHIQMNEFGESNICNLYLDTPDYALIRRSIEKPVYKEKLRLRSYGVPNYNSAVFLELKKKYKSVVYKRRISLPLMDAYQFIASKQIRPDATQIEKELCWSLNHYNQLTPKMHISYNRLAFEGRDNPDLRITFDRDIKWRSGSLDLAKGISGAPLLRPDQWLMEIKIPGVFPLWLSQYLDCLQVYPISFSKYGRCYQQSLQRPIIVMKGERRYA